MSHVVATAVLLHRGGRRRGTMGRRSAARARHRTPLRLRAPGRPGPADPAARQCLRRRTAAHGRASPSPIVVFEGGLALDFRELRAAGDGVFRLTVVALPISFSLASAVAHLVGRMPWAPSLLYGAITVVTGPTVVLPLLRKHAAPGASGVVLQVGSQSSTIRSAR